LIQPTDLPERARGHHVGAEDVAEDEIAAAVAAVLEERA
jgi:hypothetical protein